VSHLCRAIAAVSFAELCSFMQHLQLRWSINGGNIFKSVDVYS
jgi:hypothetical protein